MLSSYLVLHILSRCCGTSLAASYCSHAFRSSFCASLRLVLPPSLLACSSHVSPLLCRYVTDEDLQFFKAHMEQNVPLEGATAWEPMMNRDFGSFTYTAWRRTLPVRTAEHHSCPSQLPSLLLPSCVML